MAPHSIPQRCSRAPAARPVAERGAAVFVVVLVITLLSALGLFAVRAASQANLTSGYNRQMTQTHYMADYAVMLAAAELGGDARQAYADEMWARDPVTRQPKYQGQCQAMGAVSNPTCFPVYYGDFDRRTKLHSTEPVLATDSLGPVPLQGDLRVELTDIRRAQPPMAGMSLTGQEGTMPSYFSATISATGQVRPPVADPTLCEPASRGLLGIESARAHVVVGPLMH